jgi:hypothetical protein
MPEICRFFGIVVAMYYEDHTPPHFHARYAGHRARFALGPVRLLSGSLSPRVMGLIMEWAVMHEIEILEDWELARRGKSLKPIQPLE